MACPPDFKHKKRRWHSLLSSFLYCTLYIRDIDQPYKSRGRIIQKILHDLADLRDRLHRVNGRTQRVRIL